MKRSFDGTLSIQKKCSKGHFKNYFNSRDHLVFLEEKVKGVKLVILAHLVCKVDLGPLDLKDVLV